jgi:DNA repair exonuclease SbcCD ATPase subunit
MDKEYFFFGIFLIWYLSHNDPEEFLQLIVRIYYRLKNIVKYYYTLTVKNTENLKVVVITDSIPQVKYEDKYLNEIRKLEKEFKFDEDEKELQIQKTQEFMSEISEQYEKKINDLEHEISVVENLCPDKEELFEEKNKILDELNNLIDINKQELSNTNTLKKAEEMSRNYVIDKRIEKLNNCYVIEQTPLGNVMMIYDKEKNSFKYYSDNTIPYRYLEPVARKYVKFFNCRPIFVDMEEELKNAEEKWEREKEAKEKELNEKEAKEVNEKVEQKKSVFAKFKSYNKEAGSGRVNVAPPPKNSIPNRVLTDAQEKEKILLKEKANRYTYEGKLVNFSFIKKVDRKIVDKKYSMSFADFKKNVLQKSYI